MYRPVAYRASVLFFTIIDLSAIDPMYQYSLQWFAGLFGSSIDNSPKSKTNNAQERIGFLNNFFTLQLYENICRSLFEKHKLLFSLILCVKILFGDGKMDADEWRFFLAGATGQIDIVPNPTDWLGDLEWGETYKQLFCMSKLTSLAGVDKYFIEHQAKFKVLFDSNEPENLPMPGELDKKDYFQKMIVLKSLRPDKIPFAVQNYVSEKIGKQFIEPPTFSIAKSF